jgi:hypothetical protein
VSGRRAALEDSRYVWVADKVVEYFRLERGQLSRGILAGRAAKSVTTLPVAFRTPETRQENGLPDYVTELSLLIASLFSNSLVQYCRKTSAESAAACS